MIELPFGSISPLWAGNPFALAPPFSTPMMRSTGSGATAMPLSAPTSPPGIAARPAQPAIGTADPYGFSAAPMLNPFGGLNAAYPAPFAFASAYPGLLAPAVPPTLATLLATVAVRRGQPAGPSNDQEIEDFVYDVLELLAGTSEVEIRSEGGRATLTGSVPHKRVKHDVGEVVWAIPGINDVQNNVTINTRRRTRAASREGEQQAAGTTRKQT